jgi:hypothetical protein
MNEDKLGTLEEAIEFDKKRNYQYTTPVAWTDGKFCLSFAESDVCPIPLYTAPRELSDEEINQIFADILTNHKFGEDVTKKFARAILKKASEK